MGNGFFGYKLITPDGQAFDLNETKWQVDIGIPDGFNLPPISHNTQTLYAQPGAILKSVQVLPRTVTITAKLIAQCRDELHQVRAALWQAFRWNREDTNPPGYSTLRYESNGHTADLHCYFLSDVESGGDGETSQAIGYKLIAYDPYWYGEAKSADLKISDEVYSDYIVRRNGATWDTMAGGLNGYVYELATNNDGATVYAVGAFTMANGGTLNVNYVSKWNGTLWEELGVGADAAVYCVHIAADGKIYVGGQFANIGGVATRGIAYWDGAAWNALGTGALNNIVYDIAEDINGNIYAIGNFTQMGGVASTAGVAKWDGSAWSAMGTGHTLGGAGENGNRLIVLPNQNVLALGAFLNASGVASTRYGALWNGTAWSSVGAEAATIGTINDAILTSAGIVYAVSTNYNVWKWNGATQWVSVAVGNNALFSINQLRNGRIIVSGLSTGISYPPSTASGLGLSNKNCFAIVGNTLEYYELATGGAVFYDLLDTPNGIIQTTRTSAASAILQGLTNVTMEGDAEAFPVLTIKNGCVLCSVENITTGKRISLNYGNVPGETVTIDLTPLTKTIESDIRGNLFPYSTAIPITDFASFSLAPEPLAPNGANLIALYLFWRGHSATNRYWYERNDNNNQLTYYFLTGVTFSNTDEGRLYVSIVDDGGGFYHVDIYKDLARTQLVAHTASYNSTGTKTVIADNSSGIGGTLYVSAVTAVDTDITVDYAVAKIEWHDRFLSADSAVAPERIK